VQHVDGVLPAWPLDHADLEPYCTRAEQLYQVHGVRGVDPTDTRRAPATRTPDQPRAAVRAAARRSRRGRAAPVRAAQRDLTTEDLPLRENQAVVAGAGRISLRYRPTNLSAHGKLRERFVGLLQAMRCERDVLENYSYRGGRLGLSGLAHQNGTVRFGTDPAMSALDVDCRMHDLDNQPLRHRLQFLRLQLRGQPDPDDHRERPAGGGDNAARVGADWVPVAASFAGLRVLVTGAAFGRLDVRTTTPECPGRTGRLWEYAEEEFAAVLADDLVGIWRCLKFEARQMMAQGGGPIVSTSSLLAGVGMADNGAYTAAKHGVHGLTRCAALELAPHGVRVNAVAPGVTRTGMTSGVSDDLLADVPLGRIADPEEVADAVLWLAGSSYATGSVLTVDGGYTAR
jgi:NAD(P)-dependent dehydrogenase (short-subunit alcohol dehydrogenase family)